MPIQQPATSVFDLKVNDAQSTLLPCPFCGSGAKMARRAGFAGYEHDLVWVSCINEECKVTSPSIDCERWEAGKGTFYVYDEAIETAVTWWNRRAPLPLAIARLHCAEAAFAEDIEPLDLGPEQPDGSAT